MCNTPYPQDTLQQYSSGSRISSQEGLKGDSLREMRVLLIEIHHTKRCVKGPNPNICRPLSANRVLTRLGQNGAAEPIAITGIHTRRGDLDPGTQIHPERMPCEEGGRNWSECQRMPKIANSNQKLAERHGAGSPSGTKTRSQQKGMEQVLPQEPTLLTP